MSSTFATSTHKGSQGYLNNCVLQAPVSECWGSARPTTNASSKIFLSFRKSTFLDPFSRLPFSVLVADEQEKTHCINCVQWVYFAYD